MPKGINGAKGCKERQGEAIGYQKAMAKIESLLVQKLISKIPIKNVQNEARYLGIEGKAFEKLVLAAYDKITGKGEKPSFDLQQEAFRISEILLFCKKTRILALVLRLAILLQLLSR